MTQTPTSRWLNPRIYRNAAFAVATTGSLLTGLNWREQNVAAFIGIMVLFVAAFWAVAGVMAALKRQQTGLAVQCLLLMMWSVLLPLALLSRAAA